MIRATVIIAAFASTLYLFCCSCATTFEMGKVEYYTVVLRKPSFVDPTREHLYGPYTVVSGDIEIEGTDAAELTPEKIVLCGRKFDITKVKTETGNGRLHFTFEVKDPDHFRRLPVDATEPWGGLFETEADREKRSRVRIIFRRKTDGATLIGKGRIERAMPPGWENLKAGEQ